MRRDVREEKTENLPREMKGSRQRVKMTTVPVKTLIGSLTVKMNPPAKSKLKVRLSAKAANRNSTEGKNINTDLPKM